MKTYDPTALQKAKDIANQYKHEVLPAFALGFDPSRRVIEQQQKANALGAQLRFLFQMAAWQTIESAQHLLKVLEKPQNPVLRGIGVLDTMVYPHVEWFGRMRDVPPTAQSSSFPFKEKEGRSISYLKITPRNKVLEKDFDDPRAFYYEEASTCFLTIDSGKYGTNICIEVDGLADGGFSPHSEFADFYSNFKDDLEAALSHYPKPHTWYRHSNYHLQDQGREQLEAIAEYGQSGDRYMGVASRVSYRPRAIDLASVINYDAANANQPYSLSTLIQKFSKVPDSILSDHKARALKKDILTLVFDAAREELLFTNSEPKSGAALELAQQLSLLPAHYKIA